MICEKTDINDENVVPISSNSNFNTDFKAGSEAGSEDYYFDTLNNFTFEGDLIFSNFNHIADFQNNLFLFAKSVLIFTSYDCKLNDCMDHYIAMNKLKNQDYVQGSCDSESINCSDGSGDFKNSSNCNATEQIKNFKQNKSQKKTLKNLIMLLLPNQEVRSKFDNLIKGFSITKDNKIKCTLDESTKDKVSDIKRNSLMIDVIELILTKSFMFYKKNICIAKNNRLNLRKNIDISNLTFNSYKNNKFKRKKNWYKKDV